LSCKRNQRPFLQITASVRKFASFTFPAPVCGYHCLVCIRRPQKTVCRVCSSAPSPSKLSALFCTSAFATNL
jgi:hypothetical protein